jgi:predicted DsbA family dithiol-disulfide isomerase
MSFLLSIKKIDFFSFLLTCFVDKNRGNSLDSHRLIHYTGKQAPEKQHTLVEELFIGYFTQGKFIGDRYLSLGSCPQNM